ncbi:MAG TPA: hypothetical protein VHY91_04645 [Pirellulales bacterium]|jgi:hypothetical protein|nr:hypothetical protein [Pirellulales bacterium]
MSTILIAAAVAHFLAGLALFTLAGMTAAALGRTAGRSAIGWGLTVMIALGLAEWCDVAVGGSVRPACQWVRLALDAVALVGLVELGRLCTVGPRAGLLPRWCYPVAAGLALVAVLLSKLDLLAFVVQLAICWQAGWLAANYLRSGEGSVGRMGHAAMRAIGSGTLAARAIVGGLLIYLVAACVVIPLASVVAICAIGPATLATRAAVGGPLAYLLAACFAIPLPGMLAALIAAVAAYLAFGSSIGQNRQAALRWRCAWPIGFAVVAVAGCFGLAAAGVFDTDWRLAEMASAELSKAQAADADDDQATAEGDPQAADHEDAGSETAVVREAKRVGLSLSPIIVFLLLIWGLSRLPFVH